LVLQQAVHAQHSKHLLKIRGFSEVKVEKVKEAVKKCLVCKPYSLPSD
jgi:N-acetylglutamate synthase-like GNAT family acetyltransferase